MPIRADALACAAQGLAAASPRIRLPPLGPGPLRASLEARGAAAPAPEQGPRTAGAAPPPIPGALVAFAPPADGRPRASSMMTAQGGASATQAGRQPPHAAPDGAADSWPATDDLIAFTPPPAGAAGARSRRPACHSVLLPLRALLDARREGVLWSTTVRWHGTYSYWRCSARAWTAARGSRHAHGVPCEAAPASAALTTHPREAPKVCAHAGGRPVRVEAEDAAGLAHAAGEPAAAGPLEAQLRTSAEAGLHAGGARAQQVTLVTLLKDGLRSGLLVPYCRTYWSGPSVTLLTLAWPCFEEQCFPGGLRAHPSLSYRVF